MRPVGGICCTGKLPKHLNLVIIFFDKTYIFKYAPQHKHCVRLYFEEKKLTFNKSDSASVFRCFPPSHLGAGSNDEHEDSSEIESVALEGPDSNDNHEDSSKMESVAFEGAESSGLSDCAPQESPVAEAGPGVSYPGYKQYCRWTKWTDFQIIFRHATSH